jgi:hypothetical protein
MDCQSKPYEVGFEISTVVNIAGPFEIPNVVIIIVCFNEGQSFN